MKRLLFAALALASCKGEVTPFAKASRLDSLDQAIGGPTASARAGDFLLENDQIRVIVEQGGRSRTPLDVGGSIVDVDLVRPEAELRGGHGLDQLGQIAPVSNLFIAGAIGQQDVKITQSTEGAEVSARAKSRPILKLLDALGLLIKRDFAGSEPDYGTFQVYNEYRLKPGERIVRIRTTIGYGVPFCPPEPGDGCNEACDDVLYDSDCVCPSVPSRCSARVSVIEADPLPDRPEPAGLSDVILGDLPRPFGSKSCQEDVDCDSGAGETCADITTVLGGTARVCRGPNNKDAGFFVGDMLLYGGHLSPFIRGTGFDTDTDLRRLFDSGEDTLSTPLQLDAVYAIGDRLSYAYASSAGKVFVPIFGGPFSMGATHAKACAHGERGCLRRKLVRSERWLAVGNGDASSAGEALLIARGEERGVVNGVVQWAHSGDPVSGADVFLLEDPRRISCEGECLDRCGDVSGVSDQAASQWTVDDLFTHNRCRTPSVTHRQGVAGIVTFAKTDPGTDPVKDGRFHLVAAPGRYFLVAQNGRGAISRPEPLEITANGEEGAALMLVEPGRLRFSIFDESGALSPGRVTVGRCLPSAPCRSDDQCGAGERCEAGACACERKRLQPLELGGGRLSDGIVAVQQTLDGKGEIELRPGEYELVFSRGPYRSIERKSVKIEPDVATEVTGTVMRTADRSGWSTADFHVHAGASLDSGLPLEDRAVSFIAEDMDFLSSSDHDVLTRYAPLLEKMGVTSRLKSQVGVEVTTQEIGHFIGWPLAYKEWTEEGERVLGNNAPDWRELTPGEIFSEIRERQAEGLPIVVEVPHPYTYFDFYRLDTHTLEPSDSIISLLNPLAAADKFSGLFDAMELVNSKAMDLIRRPTVGDVRFYSQGFDRIRAAYGAGMIDEATYQRQLLEHSTETVRRFLHRTRAEQKAAIEGRGRELDCRCGSDGDCGTGRVCKPDTMTCVATSTIPVSPPPGELLCKSLRGTVDDWFVMLNRGVRRTGLSGSDVHSLTDVEAGVPRTLLRTGATTPPHLTENEIAEAVLGGRAVVTNGPMIRFNVGGGEIGETIVASEGSPVEISIRVETGGWYDVDRVELYRNGELLHWWSGCGSTREDEVDPDGHPCLPQGTASPVALDERLQDQPERDAWYAVIALGVDGRTLIPVYTTTALARLGTFELTQRIYDLIPALSSLRTPRFPSIFPTFPFAVTNPIWVDLGGDGWSAPLEPPSWCTPGKDTACGGSQ
jgi:hypothetical protein